METHSRGLLLRAEPTSQFVAPPVYLHRALLLCEALHGTGELTAKLSLPELPSLRRDLYALTAGRDGASVPNWRDLIPREVFDELHAEIDA